MKKQLFRFKNIVQSFLTNLSSFDPYQPIGANRREKTFTIDMIVSEEDYEPFNSNRGNGRHK